MLPYKSLKGFSEVLVKKTCISAYEIYSPILFTNFHSCGYRVLMSACVSVCVSVSLSVCLSVYMITKK